MGAFVTYLYTNYGIKNFLVVAPDLTIYNKLIKDFSDSTSPKYVFAGADINVVTGDNYQTRNVCLSAKKAVFKRSYARAKR